MGSGWRIGLRILILVTLIHVACPRSFNIDYDNDQFLLDDKPFQYVSGSLHYYRAPRAYWRDRLQKVRAAGLNVVSTYVEWSLHEPSPGVFDFSGEKDIQYFIQLAQEEDLLVLLRPGPYICAERDMGGLPSWLLTLKPDIKLRTNDTTYMEYVERYLTTLLTHLQPQLYANGGPIIMVQVENEYGSYPACDYDYPGQVRDLMRQLVGTAAELYTTDGAGTGYLKCGKIEGVYATVDFGPGGNVDSAFLAQRIYEPKGPLVNSEFYPGWLTHWGENLQTVGTVEILRTLEEMLLRNASVNFYMFFGGTNFGFTAGANYGNNYLPQLTSYDYDAPLTEAGDPTSKYFAIRDVILRYFPANVSMPSIKEKGNYGSVPLNLVATLMDERVREGLGSYPVRSEYPLTFEQLGQSFGFVLYETTLQYSLTDEAIFSISGISDRAIVFLDNVYKGVLSRSDTLTSISLPVMLGQKLQVLVENQGRINYGSLLKDFKGFVSNATLNDEVLTDWTITGFPLSNITWLSSLEDTPNDEFIFSEPTFFRGTFVLPESDTEPLDTYLDPTGWGKGVAFINGFNLGRFWPLKGPQVTLYVPGCYLNPYPTPNEVILLEIQAITSSSYSISFVSEAILDKPPANITHRSLHHSSLSQLNEPSQEMVSVQHL